MDSVDLLARLLADRYGAGHCELQPVRQFAHVDRSIYPIDRSNGSPWLLPAYQQDEGGCDWRQQTCALRFLNHYPLAAEIACLAHVTLQGDTATRCLVPQP